MPLFSGCSLNPRWSDSYDQRQWEGNYLSGQAAYFAHKYGEAFKFYSDAAKHGTRLAPESAKYETALTALGRCSMKLDRKKEARDYFTKAVFIDRKQLEKNASPFETNECRRALAYNLLCLGECDIALDDRENARTILTESVQNYEILSANSSDKNLDSTSATNYTSALASLLETAIHFKNLPEASKYFNKLVQPQLSIFCPPQKMNDAKQNYAALLSSLGQKKQAEQILAENKWSQQNEIAWIDLKQKHYEEAQSAFRQALTAAGESEKNTFFLTSTYTGLGEALLFLGKEAEAASYLRKALNQEDTSDINQIAQKDLAAARLVRIDLFRPFPEIDALLQNWLRLRTRTFGANSYQVADVLAALAVVYDYHHKEDQAAKYALEAANLFKSCRQPDMFVSCQMVADLLFCLKQYDQAKQTYDHCIELDEESLKYQRLRQADVLIRLAAIEYARSQSNLANADITSAQKLIVRGPNTSNRAYVVAKGISYLLRDLKEHNQIRACNYLSKALERIMSMTSQPQTPQQEKSRQVVEATLTALSQDKLPPIKRLLSKLEPGSFEASK